MRPTATVRREGGHARRQRTSCVSRASSTSTAPRRKRNSRTSAMARRLTDAGGAPAGAAMTLADVAVCDAPPSPRSYVRVSSGSPVEAAAGAVSAYQEAARRSGARGCPAQHAVVHSGAQGGGAAAAIACGRRRRWLLQDYGEACTVAGLHARAGMPCCGGGDGGGGGVVAIGSHREGVAHVSHARPPVRVLLRR